MFKDLLNAVVGYYLIVLAVSAAMGVRETLRVAPVAVAATVAGTDPGTPTATAAALGGAATARARAFVAGRTVHAAHRFGWATGMGAALGWATGIEVYRAGRRATIAAARRASDWREHRRTTRDARTDPATPAAPAAPPADGPVPHPANSGPAANGGPTAPPPGPAAQPAPTQPPEPTLRGALPPQDDATTGDTPPYRSGRPPLYLVPPSQEYPDTMPAADIHDLESLITFTGQTAQVAGMESEDAAAASASMIAGAEFAAETVLRVTDETASLEGAIAAMLMLRVDPESTAAYHALLEAGAAYRDTTATFSAQCADTADTAAQMALAAANYHETAANALAVLSSHQLPHAEAAAATGHSGAHGAFYGVADTGGQTQIPGGGAPQLPAS